MTSIVATQAQVPRQENLDDQPEQHWVFRYLLKIIPYFLSFAEAGVFVFEFLMINTLVSLALQYMSFYTENSKKPTAVYSCIATSKNLQEGSVFDVIQCVLSQDSLIILANAFHVFTWACLTCTYFIWRYQIDFQRMRKLKLSKTALLVVLITICGVISLYSIQERNNRWIYGTSNLEKNVTLVSQEPMLSSNNNNNIQQQEEIKTLFIVEEDGEDDDFMQGGSTTTPTTPLQNTTPSVTQQFVDYGRVFHLLFGAPLIEEVVLRIALTTVIQRRLGTVISSIVWTNVIFSSLHIVNALHNASNSYTMFQVFAGFILGTFYSTRLYITGNLYESLTLHILNNMAAIWIPITLTWKDIIPHFSFPLFATQMVFILLLIKDLLYIRQAHKNYDSVAPTISPSLPASLSTSPTEVAAQIQGVSGSGVMKENNKNNRSKKGESKKNK